MSDTDAAAAPAAETMPPVEETTGADAGVVEETSTAEETEEPEAEPEVIEALERRQTVSVSAADDSTDAPAEEGTATIIKEGELTKQGGSVKSWKKRYFVLTADSLAYYTKKDGAVKGGILLETASKVRAGEASETKNKQFCFVIETADRNYIQQATTQEICDAWMKAVEEVLAELKANAGDVNAVKATPKEESEPKAKSEKSADVAEAPKEEAPAPETSKITLIYWPFLGRCNAAMRMCREAGVEYERKSEFGDIAALTSAFGAKSPNFAPPILKDGDFILSQSVVIARYLGEKFGFVPESKNDHYLAHQYAMDAVDFFENNIAQKDTDGETFKAFLMGDGEKPSRFTNFASTIENCIQGPYYFGEKLTYVDFLLTALMDFSENYWANLLKEKIGKDVFEPFTKLRACVEKVRGLKSWESNSEEIAGPQMKIKDEVLAAFD